MTNEDAIEMLRSGSSHERLNAARALQATPSANAIEVLRNAVRQEKTFHVQRALVKALESCERLVDATEDENESGVSPDIRASIEAKAKEWLLGVVLHEIEPRVGLVRDTASESLEGFNDSRLKEELDSLDSVLVGLQSLYTAARKPQFTEVDISRLIRRVRDEVVPPEHRDAFSYLGESPFNLYADEHLLKLALINGLKNAYEAVLGLGEPEPHALVVALGEDDKVYWLTIIDKGPGVPDGGKWIFDVGKSGKKGHRGYGLATAKQAMQTLGGDVDLANDEGGGARFRIWWPKR